MHSYTVGLVLHWSGYNVECRCTCCIMQSCPAGSPFQDRSQSTTMKYHLPLCADPGICWWHVLNFVNTQGHIIAEMKRQMMPRSTCWSVRGIGDHDQRRQTSTTAQQPRASLAPYTTGDRPSIHTSHLQPPSSHLSPTHAYHASPAAQTPPSPHARNARRLHVPHPTQHHARTIVLQWPNAQVFPASSRIHLLFQRFDVPHIWIR